MIKYDYSLVIQLSKNNITVTYEFIYNIYERRIVDDVPDALLIQ